MRGWGSGHEASTMAALALLLASGTTDYVGQSVEGEVGEGNYTYYTLKQEGEVRLELTTLQGDADLYVAGEEEEKPNYLFEHHAMSSTTCGLDQLALSSHQKRPVHIGVYGHPRYVNTRYRLDVVIVTAVEFDPFGTVEEGGEGGGSREEKRERSEGRRRSSDREEQSDFWSGEQSTVKVIFTVLRQILEIVLDIMI